MVKNTPLDRAMWKKKAMAFVTRSHRHLWGKNNEDPQAFLFTRGLKNQFIKDALMGWNKFGQQRPMENWGFESGNKKLFLPAGVVVPFIVEKELRSVFIHSFYENKTDENKKKQTLVLPGSLHSTLVLRNDSDGSTGDRGLVKTAVIQNLIDGLFLFQETGRSCSVMIHPDPCLVLENHLQKIIKNAGSLFIFSADKEEYALNRQIFSDVPEHRFYTYQSKEELIEIFLMH